MSAAPAPRACRLRIADFFFIHSCPGSLTKNIKCKARTVRIQQYADSPRQKITTLMYYTVYFFFFSCPRPSLWAEASSMLEIIHIITELITGHYRVRLCSGWSRSTTTGGRSMHILCMLDVNTIKNRRRGTDFIVYISLYKKTGKKCGSLGTVC